ncbi:MAG TPA: permease prefix domain 1-containing protein [Bacillota bacterium]|nr:permease prefix domain 1-containing protein [Bacillota bacterium]
MTSLDRINEYVNDVCQQIRWKKARSRISEEMTNHIIDGRDSYMAQGFDERAATEKALAETGGAAEIGAQLDRVHRPRPQWGMFAATAVLLTLGLLVGLLVFGDEVRTGLRLAYTGIGIAGMISAYFADFTIIGKHPKVIYFGVISLFIAVLLFSPTLNGKSYYAQYIILLLPLAFSAIVFAARNKGYLGILLCESALVLSCCLSLYVPSIGSFLQLAVIGTALLGIAVYKNWFGTKRSYGFSLILSPGVLLAIAALINMTQNGWSRLAVAFNPYIDPNGAGYIGVIVRELLRGAAFFGKGTIPKGYISGLTEPSQVFYTDLILPHQMYYTDLLLTALISLFGWVAFAVILSASLFFIVKGFMLCLKQKSSLGLFVSMAIMMTFCMQVISYIAFNLGFILVAPVSLPFISYGSAATVINLVLVGFMLSVFRTGDAAADGKILTAARLNRFISWNDGTLTINFKDQ